MSGESPVNGSPNSEHVASVTGQDLLTTCPACGREVSRSARTCPHCGHGLHRRRFNRRLVTLVGVVIIVLVAPIAAYGLGVRPAGLFSRPASSPAPLTTEQVIALVQPSVVTVKVSVFRGGTSEGSGFVYGKRGLILTNAHVVAKALSISVVDAAGITHSADLIGVDRSADVAELDVADMEAGDSAAKPLKATNRPVAVGSNVLVIGNPFGLLPNTVTNGLVGGTGRELTVGSTTYHDLIQTNAVSNPGNSGGPMVNPLGEVEGIVTLGGSGYAFAIPVTTFDPDAKSWTTDPTAIKLGPPLVTASASTLAISASLLPPGFQMTINEAWGSTGYHLGYLKQSTQYVGGEFIDSYVDVRPSESDAHTSYAGYLASDQKTGFVIQGSTGQLGDEWTILRADPSGSFTYEILWRDRNVVAILYWDAALPNYDVSSDGALALAVQDETLISADLASYQ